jgi:phosphinothricin acetyltransferase
MVMVRAGAEHDLPALTAIYNHYVLHTPITFDVTPFEPEQRRDWFAAHAATGRHRLIVAEEAGRIVGYATTSRWRQKPAYDTTVESTVYCRHDASGRGIGTLLYRSLFDLLANEDVHQIVAGVALPNDASVRMHERVGFRQVGVFHGVGRKFDRYWDVAWFERPLIPSSASSA